MAETGSALLPLVLWPGALSISGTIVQGHKTNGYTVKVKIMKWLRGTRPRRRIYDTYTYLTV